MGCSAGGRPWCGVVLLLLLLLLVLSIFCCCRWAAVPHVVVVVAAAIVAVVGWLHALDGWRLKPTPLGLVRRRFFCLPATVCAVPCMVCIGLPTGYSTLRDCAWLHLASHVRLREAGLARLSHARVVHAVPPRMMLGGEMALGFSPGSTESEYIFTHCRTALCHATAPPTWRSGTRAERAIAAARCERARKSEEERERECVYVIAAGWAGVRARTGPVSRALTLSR